MDLHPACSIDVFEPEDPINKELEEMIDVEEEELAASPPIPSTDTT